jgi:hypothetical protein
VAGPLCLLRTADRDHPARLVIAIGAFHTDESFPTASYASDLLFDGDLLDNMLATAFSEHNVLAWQDEVRYTPAGITGSKIQYFDDPRIFDPEQRADAISAFIEDNSNDFFFLKSDDFETEHEYRAVVMPTDGFDTGPSEALSFKDDYAFVDYGDALVAVIVGERFPNSQLLGASRAAERAGARLGKIGWHQGRPMAFPPVLDDPPNSTTYHAVNVSRTAQN